MGATRHGKYKVCGDSGLASSRAIISLSLMLALSRARSCSKSTTSSSFRATAALHSARLRSSPSTCA